MPFYTIQNNKPRRADSDLQFDVRAGYRDIGYVNRVGRKWIARFEALGRDAFEATPFTSKKAAISWMEAEARSYHDLLAETPGYTRFRVVETRDGMHAGSLADLVDILTEEGCPVVSTTANQKPTTYHVNWDNDSVRTTYLGYALESGLMSFRFLIESSEIVERLKSEFPGDVLDLGEAVLCPNPNARLTIDEARAKLRDQGRITR